MKTGMIALVILGVLAAGAMTLGFMVMGTYNDLTEQEAGIKGQYDVDRNTYDNMFKSFKEAAQVPDMYASDLKKVYDSAIKARYGEDGSKALFQMIKEQNPSFDSTLYARLMDTLKSGRLRFEENQNNLVDRRRAYETSLRRFPNNVVAGIFGFPRIDLAKYDIVTSDATENAFSTKKADAVQLR